MWVEMGRHAGEASWAIIDGHGSGSLSQEQGEAVEKNYSKGSDPFAFFFLRKQRSLVLEGPLETSRHTLNLQ